jgi:hypothetical protein
VSEPSRRPSPPFNPNPNLCPSPSPSPSPSLSPGPNPTNQAAKSAFETLALRFAEIQSLEHADAECTAFRRAGASLMGVHWMHSKRPADLRDSAGCTASFEFPPVYDS